MTHSLRKTNLLPSKGKRKNGAEVRSSGVSRFFSLASEGAYVIYSLLEELGMDQWAVASENRALMCTGVALGVAYGLAWFLLAYGDVSLGSLHIRSWSELNDAKYVFDTPTLHVALMTRHTLTFKILYTQGNRLCSQEGERYLEDVLVDKQFLIPVSLEVQGVLLRLRIAIPMVKVDDLQVSKVHFGFA
ncbi:transport protein Sec23-like protein [Tanacetum coccineum]|uniref:Transport protein Sec23-like protein n=1 Tax=Tanacetum coccineum TaxID=301880 RepID=A0ABQ5IC42_9ASTR